MHNYKKFLFITILVAVAALVSFLRFPEAFTAVSWIMIRYILPVAACIAAVFFVLRAIFRFFKRHKGILVLTVLLAGALLFFFRKPLSAFAASVWSTAEPVVENVLVLVITIALTLVCTAFVLYLLFGAFIPVRRVRYRRGASHAAHAAGAAAGAAFMYDDYINNGKSEYEEACDRMNQEYEQQCAYEYQQQREQDFQDQRDFMWEQEQQQQYDQWYDNYLHDYYPENY